jgi:type III restriction enzyme
MATGRNRPPTPQEPPNEWTPTQAAPDPILNNPYEEPSQHWSYAGGVPSKTPGRRPASYWFKTTKIGTTQEKLFAEEERDELPLVNKLRADVSNWRRSKEPYRGASKVTKELFAYWFSQDRHRPLFFCQREAVETIVYLLEIAIPGRLAATGYGKFKVDAEALAKLLRGENAFSELTEKKYYPKLTDAPADSSALPLKRLGCKMATGSGKTIVMGMLIAWAFCNRGRNPSSTHFPNAVLIVAPNLTVKERLQVLRPDTADNYYDVFDLVPAKYRELLNAGKVLVTNWHAFAPKSPHKEGETSYTVVNKGDETNDAFTLDRLGELAARLPILVLNDEGHHCWRPNAAAQAEKIEEALKKEELNKEEQEKLKEDAEEARVWLAGLDRMNNSGLLGQGIPSILAAVDLSATPFYLPNSGYPDGSPFPWLVSDFGLVDAIESGIVKVPRLPVKDDSGGKDDAGRPDPRYFRLWTHIKESLKPGADFIGKRPKPDSLYREAEGALLTLAAQWKEKFDKTRKDSAEPNPIPPVMIVVCDNTDLSQLVFESISGEKEEEVLGEDGKVIKKKIFRGSQINFPDLANSEGVRHTFRIDSKLLAKIETEGAETKDEAAQELRELIASVGKRGGKGEQVRCVVSVGMLTEGWDANNVTHILGIRAFGSQLLCEQVVGRGLRRMNYTPDPVTKLLPAEYVDVYGIPFSLIPYKGRTETEKPNDPVYHHIHAEADRVQHRIGIPVVESYTYDIKGSGITCDVAKLEGLHVEDEPTKVYLAPQKGYRDATHVGEDGDFVEQTREQFYAAVRMQQVLFRFTQDIVDDLIAGGEGKGVEELKRNLLSRHTLFPEVFRIVQKYVATKVTFAPGVDPREIALKKPATLLRERVRNGIVDAVAPKDAPLLPIVNSFQPEVDTKDVSDYTSRPVVSLKKSHLNYAPILSDWERQAIDVLEESDAVKSYTPNMRKLGFQVHYDYQDAIHHYEPDFVVKLANDTMLILEIKGKAGELHEPDRVNAKSQAARKWVAAINNAKRYGKWDYDICREIPALAARLDALAGIARTSRVLPFRSVQNPSEKQRFTTCVPLVGLRAAAGYWSEEQIGIEGLESIANDWIEWDTKTQFKPGMFVARVRGDSMEPLIPANSYCLFRPPGIGTRQGKRLLIWHRGVTDSETGGQYTVKVYESEKVVKEDEWEHKSITLKPLNPKYDPIVLTPTDEGDVRVLAEFIEVVGAAPEVE